MNNDFISFTAPQASLLLTEDNPVEQKIALTLLEPLGIQIDTADNGRAALDMVIKKRPDLILLDYEMPHVDGKQVLEMIRNETEFYDIPVVFLTRKEDRESFLRVQPLKPEGYLLKSMLPGQIVNAVDDFFTNRKWG